MSKSMDEVRRSVLLDAMSRVRVVYVEDFFTGRRSARFECVACERPVAFNQEKGWLECPVCTYEVRQVEARDLVMAHMRLLDVLAQDLGVDLFGDLVVELAREKSSAMVDKVKAAFTRAVGGRNGRV